jgi:hypothetical protein
MDLKQTFEIGKKPLIVMGVSLLASDIVYSAGYAEFSIIIFPLFLGLISYFAHIYSRENTLVATAVASVIITNTAIIAEGIALGLLLVIAMAIGMFPGLTLIGIVESVIESIVVGVTLFSMIALVVGAVMWVIVRKVL